MSSKMTWNQFRFGYEMTIDGNGEASTAQPFTGDPQGPLRDFTHANRIVGTHSTAFNTDEGNPERSPACWGSLTWGILRGNENSNSTNTFSQLLLSSGLDDDTDEPWLWRQDETVFMWAQGLDISTVVAHIPLRMDGGVHVLAGGQFQSVGNSVALPTRMDIPLRGGRGTSLDRDTLLVFVSSFRAYHANFPTLGNAIRGFSWTIRGTFYGRLLLTRDA